jgi:DNA uptake protein ComE-like DNA-binding protein
MSNDFLFRLKSYFNYHKTERNGVFFLLFIIISVLVAQQFIPGLFHEETVDYSTYQEKIAQWKKEMETRNKQEKATHTPFYFDPNHLDSLGFIKLGLSKWQTKTILHYRRKNGRFRNKQDFKKMNGMNDSLFLILSPYIRLSKKNTTKSYKKQKTYTGTPKLFDFDPNTISYDSLRQLGFSDKIAAQIIAYRNHSGHFSKKEQMLKIYDMDTALYQRIEKHIRIEEIRPKTNKYIKDNTPKPKTAIRIELNLADTLDLQQLYDIGPGFARRIVKYRNNLGGFYRKEQLKEVWGIDEEKYQKIEQYCFVDTQKIRKIDINKATIKQLNRHPYIDFSIAKRIILLRQKKGGRFGSLEELKEIEMLYDKLFQKISPYLEVK